MDSCRIHSGHSMKQVRRKLYAGSTKSYKTPESLGLLFYKKLVFKKFIKMILQHLLQTYYVLYRV
ncbi:hypothetical protein M2408_002274 [Sphingobacterium sp. BIGb0165]|nr:hypothetical protein [Sphingobacterium sp. BIGb0165]